MEHDSARLLDGNRSTHFLRRNKRALLITLLIIGIISVVVIVTAATLIAQQSPSAPQNVILFIGVSRSCCFWWASLICGAC
jgi:hypothetical protein